VDIAIEAQHIFPVLIPHKSIRIEALIKKLIVAHLAKISSKYFESVIVKDASNCALS
jgi:hypothetical protein